MLNFFFFSYLKKKTQKKNEWDKIVHNVNLKDSETTNGKEIARMK